MRSIRGPNCGSNLGTGEGEKSKTSYTVVSSIRPVDNWSISGQSRVERSLVIGSIVSTVVNKKLS